MFLHLLTGKEKRYVYVTHTLCCKAPIWILLTTYLNSNNNNNNNTNNKSPI